MGKHANSLTSLSKKSFMVQSMNRFMYTVH